MPASRSYDADALIGPLYFLAVLLIVNPAIDFVAGVQPLSFDNLQWRFGAVGLLSGFILTPLLGIVLAIGVAHYAEHYVVQRILAVLNVLTALGFLMLLVLFVLDVLQLKNLVQPEAEAQFASAAWKAILKHGLFVVVTGWLGVAGFRLAKQERVERGGIGSMVAGTR
jgi:cytochrome bd-type quinol oxidase subunit 2